MNWKKQKIKWIDDFIEESKLEDDDEIDMELLVEWLAKKALMAQRQALHPS